jgi:hypothetical protein
MITTKSAKKKIKSIKKAAIDRIDHITTNEKIVGAAALGAAVGVAATALGSSLLHGSSSDKAPASAKASGKMAAAKS